MTVISLAAEREKREPHLCGTVTCLACRHEWEAVAPVGCADGLECPSCALPRGVWKYNFGAQEGDAVLTCDCGNDVLTAYRRDGAHYVKCMACGDDLSDCF